MARRVYLHIGVMKSATSYLQGLCEQNSERLAAAGILWCPDHLRYQAVREAVGKSRGGPDERRHWVDLAERMRRHRGDVLLSNELLAGWRLPQIRRLVGALPEAEVRVIISARDLARIIPSHWQTTIKNGKTWSWADFASAVCSDGSDDAEGVAGWDGGDGADDDDAGPEDELSGVETGTTVSTTSAWFWRRHDLSVIVTRWAHVVPADHISLVTVPAHSTDVQTMAERFGSAVGVDVVGFEQPDSRGNPSLGAHSVELLRRINSPMTQTTFDDPDHRYGRALGRALAAGADLEPRFALSQSQQDWVRRRAEAIIKETARLGVTVVGDLADLLPSESAPSGAVDPGDTTETELLMAASRGLVCLAPDYNQLRTQRNELLRRLNTAEIEEAPKLVDRLRARLGGRRNVDVG